MTQPLYQGTTVAQRFWPKVDRRDEESCWPWTATKIRHGYGQIYLPGGTRKNAHRATELEAQRDKVIELCTWEDGEERDEVSASEILEIYAADGQIDRSSVNGIRREEKAKFIAMLRDKARWHIETGTPGDATLNDLADDLERELAEPPTIATQADCPACSGDIGGPHDADCVTEKLRAEVDADLAGSPGPDVQLAEINARGEAERDVIAAAKKLVEWWKGEHGAEVDSAAQTLDDHQLNLYCAVDALGAAERGETDEVRHG